MSPYDDWNQKDDFEKRIEMQEGVNNSETPVPQTSASYYIDKPDATYHRKKRRPSFFGTLSLVLISALIGGTVGAYIAPMYLYGKILPYPPNMQGGLAPQNIEIITKDEDYNVVPAVAKKGMPAVVGITTVTLEKDFFFGYQRGQGVGTGVIVDSKGYILTNSHVVNDGQTEEVTVLLSNGESMKAEVKWNDALLDLAIIKVEAQNLTVADLGDSDKLTVGEMAIAIGNPLGLSFERTVTSGIISGLDRSIPLSEFESIEGLIQTDASINPGNSGGPLLNNKGEVIGINTAKIQTGEGLGFAIPINIAKPIVDQIIEKGEFTKVYMGIKGVNAQQYIRSYGKNIGTDHGVFVYQVYPESPVQKAGLQEGDVIVAIDDVKIDTMRQLVRLLYQHRPGDRVKVAFIRGGEQKYADVVLEAAQEQ
ncbi:MAG: serine protease HtrA [Bacillota bacterium]